MKLEKAIEIIEHYQLWRTGKIDNTEHCPKELTEALDLIIDVSNAKIRRDQLNDFLKRESEETKDLKIEEAAERYAHNWFNIHQTNNYQALKQGYEAGAKIMEDILYNKDDLKEAYYQGMYSITSGRNFNDWLKHFKK